MQTFAKLAPFAFMLGCTDMETVSPDEVATPEESGDDGDPTAYPDAPEISFVQWTLAWLPVVLLYLPIGWWLLTRVLFQVPADLGRSGEVIAADTLLADADLRKWVEIAGASPTPVAAASFDSTAGERLLKAQLRVADLAAFGAFSRAELAAVGALLKYVELTQLGKKPCLRPPRRTGASDRLVIDAPTRTSLELLRSLSGERGTSLLGVIDRTVTGPGARELAGRLASPLRDPEAIAARMGPRPIPGASRWRSMRFTPDRGNATSTAGSSPGTRWPKR